MLTTLIHTLARWTIGKVALGNCTGAIPEIPVAPTNLYSDYQKNSINYNQNNNTLEKQHS